MAEYNTHHSVAIKVGGRRRRGEGKGEPSVGNPRTMTFGFSGYKVHYRSNGPPAWIMALCWPIAHRGGPGVRGPANTHAEGRRENTATHKTHIAHTVRRTRINAR